MNIPGHQLPPAEGEGPPKPKAKPKAGTLRGVEAAESIHRQKSEQLALLNPNVWFLKVLNAGRQEDLEFSMLQKRIMYLSETMDMYRDIIIVEEHEILARLALCEEEERARRAVHIFAKNFIKQEQGFFIQRAEIEMDEEEDRHRKEEDALGLLKRRMREMHRTIQRQELEDEIDLFLELEQTHFIERLALEVDMHRNRRMQEATAIDDLSKLCESFFGVLLVEKDELRRRNDLTAAGLNYFVSLENLFRRVLLCDVAEDAARKRLTGQADRFFADAFSMFQRTVSIQQTQQQENHRARELRELHHLALESRQAVVDEESAKFAVVIRNHQATLQAIRIAEASLNREQEEVAAEPSHSPALEPKKASENEVRLPDEKSDQFIAQPSEEIHPPQETQPTEEDPQISNDLLPTALVPMATEKPPYHYPVSSHSLNLEPNKFIADLQPPKMNEDTTSEIQGLVDLGSMPLHLLEFELRAKFLTVKTALVESLKQRVLVTSAQHLDNEQLERASRKLGFSAVCARCDPPSTNGAAMRASARPARLQRQSETTRRSSETRSVMSSEDDRAALPPLQKITSSQRGAHGSSTVPVPAPRAEISEEDKVRFEFTQKRIRLHQQFVQDDKVHLERTRTKKDAQRLRETDFNSHLEQTSRSAERQRDLSPETIKRLWNQAKRHADNASLMNKWGRNASTASRKLSPLRREL